MFYRHYFLSSSQLITLSKNTGKSSPNSFPGNLKLNKFQKDVKPQFKPKSLWLQKPVKLLTSIMPFIILTVSSYIEATRRTKTNKEGLPLQMSGNSGGN